MSEKTIFDREGVFCVSGFGAVADGMSDNTDAFQKALDKAGEKGGIVFVPPGKYAFDGHLTVPVDVTLEGTFACVPAHNGHRDAMLPEPGSAGSALLVRGDRNNEGGEPFIKLNTNSTLKGFCIYYSEQRDDAEPYPYPYTVAMRGKNPSVLDVELVNPYNGIDATGNERHFIARVYGQPLRRGIVMDGITDIGRVEDVHFNPWWSMKPAVMEIMTKYGEAFVIGRTDWEYMVNCFSIFYQVGFRFCDMGQGPANAVLTHCGHDLAPYSVVVEQTQPHAGVSFSNSQFMGEFLIKDTNKGPVKLTGCGFWGVGRMDWGYNGTPVIINMNGDCHVIVNGCHFVHWDCDSERRGSPAIRVNCRSASISSCYFSDRKKHISVEEHNRSCIITGNTFEGEEMIDKTETSRVECGLNTVLP